MVNWIRSVQITAPIPPSNVYTSVSRPTSSTDQNQRFGRFGRLAPITALNTRDAAKTRTPSASERITRNSDAATCLAVTPNRVSSSAYAVINWPWK